MPVKRKSKPMSSNSEVVEDERRPPVTQVVEVIEDHEEPDTLSAEASAPTHTILEEPSIEEKDTSSKVTVETEPASEQEDDAEGQQKRRVLVDELFQKNEHNSADVAPEISMHRRSSSRSIFIWAIVSIVACIVVGGALFFLSGNGNSVASMFARATPTPTATPTATPTPIVALSRDAITIQVLNGGGVVGAAGKMKAFLEEKGYTVKDAKNADNYDYTNTEILVKSDKTEYATLLADDLKESYSLGTAAGSLSEDSEYDAQIIVGKE